MCTEHLSVFEVLTLEGDGALDGAHRIPRDAGIVSEVDRPDLADVQGHQYGVHRLLDLDRLESAARVDGAVWKKRVSVFCLVVFS